MKLRIRGNSLRLRLLRGEVSQFSETGRVSESIAFGAKNSERLIYTLESNSGAGEITTRFSGNQITVIIPEIAARNWVESEQVSLKSEQSIGDAEDVLQILIEKDFVCLDRPEDADNKDAFPHPTGKCG